MIPKPKFKAILKYAKFIIDQYAEQSESSFFGVSHSKIFGIARIDVGGRTVTVSDREAAEAWPYIVKELGLVKDSYGEWTLPGYEMTSEKLEGLKL